MSHILWVVRVTVTTKDIDEVHRREFWVCDGKVCDLEAIGVVSIFKSIRSVPTLTRILPTLDLSCEESDQFPDLPAKKGDKFCFTSCLL